MDKRTKHTAVFALVGVLSACAMIGMNARPCDAAAVEPTSYSVRGGTAWIDFDMWTLEELGLEFVASGPDGAHVVEAHASFPLDPSSRDGTSHVSALLPEIEPCQKPVLSGEKRGNGSGWI